MYFYVQTWIYNVSFSLLLQCFSFWCLIFLKLLNSLQLDIRTKLCIRDSLYRLARSAEQRHNCATSSASIGVDGDASGAVTAEETNKYVIGLIFDSHLFLFLVIIMPCFSQFLHVKNVYAVTSYCDMARRISRFCVIFL